MKGKYAGRLVVCLDKQEHPLLSLDRLTATAGMLCLLALVYCFQMSIVGDLTEKMWVDMT